MTMLDYYSVDKRIADDCVVNRKIVEWINDFIDEEREFHHAIKLMKKLKYRYGYRNKRHKSVKQRKEVFA